VQDLKQVHGLQDHVLGAFKPVQDVNQADKVNGQVFGKFEPLCRM
jgi:hypothetical protein